MNSQNHRFFILLFVFLGVSCLAGLGIYQVLHPQKTVKVITENESIEEGVPLLGGPFSLIDQYGKPRTDKEFLGKWMLIYFGYTYCPDICPTGLQAMSEAIEEIDPKGNIVQSIFITIDPERDTVDNLRIYSENFHPGLIMLTGSPKEILKVTKAYRVYAAKVHPEETSEYLMDHSSIIYLMNPEGKYVTHFHHETPSEEMILKMREVFKNF